MIYQLTMVIVHGKLSECHQHQNAASLASIAVNANPKPRLSNVASWKIPELSGAVNGKTIELNAGLCRKPCLMKPEGKLMVFFCLPHQVCSTRSRVVSIKGWSETKNRQQEWKMSLNVDPYPIPCTLHFNYWLCLSMMHPNGLKKTENNETCDQWGKRGPQGPLPHFGQSYLLLGQFHLLDGLYVIYIYIYICLISP